MLPFVFFLRDWLSIGGFRRTGDGCILVQEAAVSEITACSGLVSGRVRHGEAVAWPSYHLSTGFIWYFLFTPRVAVGHRQLNYRFQLARYRYCYVTETFSSVPPARARLHLAAHTLVCLSVIHEAPSGHSWIPSRRLHRMPIPGLVFLGWLFPVWGSRLPWW